MIAEVEKIFDQAITVKEPVRTFILKHPRKRVCLENICASIKKCERKRYSLTLDLNTYRQIIQDYARMFGKAALLHWEQQNLSESQKHAIRKKADRLEHAQGIISELGIFGPGSGTADKISR